jgi:tetratricopeptide (TPR) repeat protein
VECSKRDDWVNAERWHRKALEAKLACGMGPVTLGISYNSLGESLLEQGKLEEAEEKLKKAMEIRTTLPHCFDAAVTRENLAQVYQAMGKPKEANQVRVDGEAKREMCCSNYRVRYTSFAM